MSKFHRTFIQQSTGGDDSNRSLMIPTDQINIKENRNYLKAILADIF